MDILLINPVCRGEENILGQLKNNLSYIEMGNMYVVPFEPPLGLASLVPGLRQRGFETALLDLRGEMLKPAQARSFLEKHKPEFVGITAMTTTYPAAIEMARLVKKTLGNCRVVLGGAHPTIMPEEVLKEDCVDYIIRGEGETRLTRLLSQGSPEGIPGVGYKKNGQIVIPGNPRPLKDINTLPMPAYDSFPTHEYIRYNQTLRSIKAISMIISRGCPFKCSFCAVKQTMGCGYRIKSPARIVEEMAKLKERYRLEGIWFKDSIFNLNARWINGFCDELEKVRLDLKWQINTRVDLVDGEQVSRMAEVGLTQIDLGIESGSPATLKTLKKTISVKRIMDAVKTAKRHVKVAGFFMIGVPGETGKDIDMTFELAKSLELDKTSWSVFTPLPGSDIYQDLKSTNRLPDNMDWEQIHFIHPAMSFSGLPHETLMERFWEIQDYFRKNGV